jgi:hypothetical protein
VPDASSRESLNVKARTALSAFLLVTLGVTGLRAHAGLVPPPSPVADTNTPGPRIKFAQNAYDFGRVKSGDPVKYSFVFTNIGDQALEVTGVTACHCIAFGEWTRTIGPGKTGVIPIDYDTTAGSGLRPISVSSNDKLQPLVVLQLSGTVWKPIDCLPAYSLLNLQPDAATASAVVKIVNNTDSPVAVFSPECGDKSFGVSLVTNQPGKEFELTISTLPPRRSGNVAGIVNVKTSSTETPVLAVQFMLNVIPEVTVNPSQIVLPQAPVTTPVTPAITVACNSTNAFHLSDATVNLPGVAVQIKEIQTNRIYSIQLTFPPGVRVPPGQPVALTARTSLPQFPLVTVPVTQLPPPAVAPPAAPQVSTPGAGIPQASAPPSPVPPRP